MFVSRTAAGQATRGERCINGESDTSPTNGRPRAPSHRLPRSSRPSQTPEQRRQLHLVHLAHGEAAVAAENERITLAGSPPTVWRSSLDARLSTATSRPSGALRPGQLTIGLGNDNFTAMRITLDRMSRIVVPKAIRDRFALKPGDELEISVELDGIRLRPLAPASPLAEESGILVCSSEVPASAWDVGAFLDEQRSQRSREIGGL